MTTILKLSSRIVPTGRTVILIALSFAFWIDTQAQIQGSVQEYIMDDATKQCVSCHSETSMGKAISDQWKESKHAEAGVGCLECHIADEGDLDAYMHNGNLIATIVTPKDCGQCHIDEVEQFTDSHHADAGMILGSIDNVLAEVVEGHTKFNNGSNPAAASGCWQCHGSKVSLLLDSDGNTVKDENGILKFDPKTWPNTGIGRVNLDGTKGSCSACHNRHHFSVEQVRQPENCGKCHMGPDHPQLEIYNESKHGINYHAHREKMNMDKKPWIVGEDYFAAPTCASCHMSATPNQPITHDVGNRISWTLRPKVSEKIDAAALAKAEISGDPLPENFLTWEERRKNMQDVCSQCHSNSYIENFYFQYDNVVELYNTKYGKPALEIMSQMKRNGILSTIDFDEKIEWTYFLLWHHEGRRARMGAAMMGPDYTQWHGNFEVAQRMYTEFIPEVKELILEAKAHGKTREANEIETMLENLLNNELHKWYIGKQDPEEVKRRKEEATKFRERYSTDQD